MAKQVRETRTVSEKDPYRPWLGNLAKPLLAGIGAVAAWLVYQTASNAKTHQYTITVTDAGCAVKYLDAPTPVNGHTMSIEATLSCAKPPSAVRLVVQLQYRADASKPWANVGTPGLIAAPPGKIAAINYVWADAPCQIGDFRAVHTLTGIGKATGQPFTEPTAASDLRTIKDGECQPPPSP
jgi:hypothetical protein